MKRFCHVIAHHFFRFAWSFFLHCIFSVEQKRQAKKIYGKMRMKFFLLVRPALCFRVSQVESTDVTDVLVLQCVAWRFFLGSFLSP